jgi:HlyD family secretion protein
MKKQLIGITLVAVTVIAGGIIWCTHHKRPQTSALVLHGNVDLRQVSLAFENGGRIVALSAEEGQRVKKGDLLASLDVETTKLQLAEAEAQTRVRQQALLKLRNGSRREEIAQARSRFASAQADFERAKKELIRLQTVDADTQGRGVSAQDLDRAQAAARVAQAKLNEQSEAVLLTERGAREEDVHSAEAQLQAVQAQVALLELTIDRGRLIAPSEGVVRARLLEAGDMATPQRPVFTLALTQPKWIRVYVGEPDLGRVQPGMSAQVWTDSHPQAMAGKVGYVAAVAEFTPKSVQTTELRTSLVYEVRVRVDDPQDQLKLGQPASVQLAAGASQ